MSLYNRAPIVLSITRCAWKRCALGIVTSRER
jgi:hypothetical protein